MRLVIDTVNTRTEGSGRADFATDEIHLRFVPRPKVPQFFSFAPPIEVSGTFDDYRFGVRPADAFGNGRALGGLAGGGADPAARRRAHSGGRARRVRESRTVVARVSLVKRRCTVRAHVVHRSRFATAPRPMVDYNCGGATRLRDQTPSSDVCIALIVAFAATFVVFKFQNLEAVDSSQLRRRRLFTPIDLRGDVK